MLAIPYVAGENNHTVQIRFRCIEKHEHRDFYHGKYNTVTGDPIRMYGVPSVLAATTEIHVTEGELDAVILRKLGLHAVAIPGAKAWKGHHRRMLAGFNNIYVWGDPDDAGAELVQKITKQMRRATALRLSVGDVSDTYLQLGADGLMDILARHKQGDE